MKSAVNSCMIHFILGLQGTQQNYEYLSTTDSPVAPKDTKISSKIYRCTVFPRLNAGGVYLKLGLVDPAFIRIRRLFIKCIFQYWRFIEPRTEFKKM